MTQRPTNQPPDAGVDPTPATTAAYRDTGQVTYEDNRDEPYLSAGLEQYRDPGEGSPQHSDTGMKDAVTGEAASVAQDMRGRGRDVAGTAAAEAKHVAREAKTQFAQLMDQVRGEATTQASDQSRRAVQGLRSLSYELNQMVSSAPQDGIAVDLVRQAADRAQSAAQWLDNRQPGEILDEVRELARRRPGAFLAGAAVLGILGGRLTRGLTADGSPTTDRTTDDTTPTSGTTTDDTTTARMAGGPWEGVR
jgi:hypothetical protein